MSDYRKMIDSTEALGQWYDTHYLEMGDGWTTPPEECNRHLDDLGVPFDKTKALLDVGFGAGHFLAEAERRVSCTGYEISEVGLRFAKQRCKESALFCHSIEEGGPQESFDYIVSIGSLEHIVDLDKALDNIRNLLKPTGKFYLYCPNERWKHFDQPNERTMNDAEWITLFHSHGLYVHHRKRWNDNTAFTGGKEYSHAFVDIVQPGAMAELSKMTLPPHGTKLNIGSGQRRFEGHGWINVDCAYRPPDQVPDLLCDVGKEPLPYPDGSMEVCVLHHVYEHLHLGEGHGLIREIHRVLKQDGSLIITIPDMRALAERWLAHQLEDYIYFVNVYGAYQGLASDTHAWGYTYQGLKADIEIALGDWSWGRITKFDWRPIPGASIAKDFWILGLEARK